MSMDDVPDLNNVPVGSNLFNYMKGTRNAIVRLDKAGNPQNCIIRCQIEFPDESGHYKEALSDDWEVALACEDGVDAAAVLDDLTARYSDRAL